MKQDIGLDFGTAIAYLVPGVIATRGISFIYPELRKLFDFGPTGTSDLAVFAILALVGIAVGFVVSAVRAATIDMSFAVSLLPIRRIFAANLLPAELRSSVTDALAYLNGVPRVEPCFPNLAVDGRLAAYLEAKAADKRPYQFYGNLIIALVMYLLGGAFERKGLEADEPAVLIVGYSVAFLTLYGAARRSHYRYMQSVRRFNQLPGCTCPSGTHDMSVGSPPLRV